MSAIIIKFIYNNNNQIMNKYDYCFSGVVIDEYDIFSSVSAAGPTRGVSSRSFNRQ